MAIALLRLKDINRSGSRGGIVRLVAVDLKVTKLLENVVGVECVDGKRAGPPDDCGALTVECITYVMHAMKTALLPPTRVQPALRNHIESLLHEGESLSAFIESAVRHQAQWREEQRAFLERGLLAEAEDDWVEPAEVYAAIRDIAKPGSRRRVRER